MQIFRNLEEVPANFGPTVVSVGNFDGVHRAHQEVVRHMAERARSFGGKAVVVTFDPHPLRILRPDVAPKLLTPLATKLALLQQTHVDAVLALPFTRDLSMMSAEDFARQILGGALQAREVHEGYNFLFQATRRRATSKRWRSWVSNAVSRPRSFPSSCCAVITSPAVRSAN